MKPKQYIEKYHLDKTFFFDRDSFIEDILDDFKLMLGAVRLSTVTFENCVQSLNIKWYNIFNGSQVKRENAEKMWKYFFATQIVPLRNFYFPDWKKSVHEHRMKTDPDYRRRYECWKMHQEIEASEREWMQEEMNERKKRIEDAEESFFTFWARMRAGFKAAMDAISGPSPEQLMKEKEVLGIPIAVPVTKEIVSSRFKSMSKMTHPDLTKEGSSDAFIALTEARDILYKVL